MNKLDFSCQQRAICIFSLFGPYYSNIWVIFGHQNLTEYQIESQYSEPNYLNIRIIWTICPNSAPRGQIMVSKLFSYQVIPKNWISVIIYYLKQLLFSKHCSRRKIMIFHPDLQYFGMTWYEKSFETIIWLPGSSGEDLQHGY